MPSKRMAKLFQGKKEVQITQKKRPLGHLVGTTGGPLRPWGRTTQPWKVLGGKTGETRSRNGPRLSKCPTNQTAVEIPTKKK